MIFRALLISQVLVQATAAFAAQSVDLKAGFREAQNQGRRNTCSAFAATGLAEYLVWAKSGEKPNFSENYAFWAGRTRGGDSGWARAQYRGVEALAGFMAVQGLEDGVAEETDWPYEGSVRSCPAGAGQEACIAGVKPRGLKEAPYRFKTEFVDRGEIAEFLVREKRPVVMNIHWYYDLVDSSGNYTRLPTAAEKRACLTQNVGCQGHVILITGYDAASDRYSFRNSWGAAWGTQGYGTLPARHVVENCEVCQHLGGLPGYDRDTAEFVRHASQGASARLE